MRTTRPLRCDLPCTTAFPTAIRLLSRTYVDAWDDRSTDFPETLQSYSPREQRDNEVQVLDAFNRPSGVNRGAKRSAFPWDLPGAVRRRAAKLFLAKLATHESADMLPAQEFEKATRVFLQRAKRFDPALTPAALAQALRNLWVFCSFRHLAGKPIALTPSALAYSLLYPYTDNTLDRSGFTTSSKERFAARVTSMLNGVTPKSPSTRERKISSLLGMIEKEFPRTRFPLVHSSLMAIHLAQLRSMKQQTGRSHRVIPALSAEKGGTSVLTDAFLAGAVPDAAWLRMAFGYGYMLQLLDDLQDMSNDTRKNSSTLFSRAGSPARRAAHASRLLRFSAETISGWDFLTKPHQRTMRRLMIHSCRILVFEAIARQRALFPADYLDTVNCHAPVSLSFLTSFRQRFPD